MKVGIVSLLSLMLACTSVVACSSAGPGNPDDPDASPTPTKDGGSGDASASQTDYCKSYCDRAHSCDNTIDEETCANKCANANAVVLSKLRDDVLDGLASCVAAKDCKS